MIALFYVTGGYVYVDPQSVAAGYEGVFTKLDAAGTRPCETGLGFKRLENFHPIISD